MGLSRASKNLLLGKRGVAKGNHNPKRTMRTPKSYLGSRGSR